MENDAFTSIATVRLPSTSRILPSSWCPDKDLVVIASRMGSRDRLSLWKMQGHKKWEVDIDTDAPSGSEIVNIAWSPDGQVIAVAHQPPAVTLHSIQDGRQERSLNVAVPQNVQGGQWRITGIWWFSEEREKKKDPIPDILNRQNDITGSAHSILKTQPLLDPLPDESQPLTATELFAFEGSHPRSTPKSSQPSVISSWPSLPTDLLAASIKPPRAGGEQSRPGEDLDEVDDSNVNSILAFSDDQGNIHSFLDGSYSLGCIHFGATCSTKTLYKNKKTTFFLHPQVSPSPQLHYTALRPTSIQLPYLKQRMLRDVARTSSSARELCWYVMRVVKEMRTAWFGSESNSGARELGPKWIRGLEERSKEGFGWREPDAMFDLMTLLLTGRATDALADYLGSAEQMSERGLQKWEASMLEALVKLRDYSEKRVAPACQRLHILLQEVQGWSQLSQFALCELPAEDVNVCLKLASRAIVCASWLAATARKELSRFKEFMVWLRYETSRGTTLTTDIHNQPLPRHDHLEVNDYLMSGLVVSSIDKWFMGPVPQFSAADLGVPSGNLAASVKLARDALKRPGGLTWPPNVKQQDLSRLDRNLDALIQELSTRCQKIFTEAARAASRSAVVVPGKEATALPQDLGARQTANAPLFIRERTAIDTSKENSNFVQHLAIQTRPHANKRSYLLLVQARYDGVGAQAFDVSVAALECCISRLRENEADGMESVEILDADFFDEQTLVIVYRPHDREGRTSIATVGYADLAYQAIEAGSYVKWTAREELAVEVLERLADGQMSAVRLPIIQSRGLIGCKDGAATLAVNGRAGRRVACVLDGAGLTLEILDMEGEEEEE